MHPACRPASSLLHRVSRQLSLNGGRSQSRGRAEEVGPRAAGTTAGHRDKETMVPSLPRWICIHLYKCTFTYLEQPIQSCNVNTRVFQVAGRVRRKWTPLSTESGAKWTRAVGAILRLAGKGHTRYMVIDTNQNLSLGSHPCSAIFTDSCWV
jgi:hypothetical protein